MALITPFNFPLEIPALQLMGALYMGNKPLLHVDQRVRRRQEEGAGPRGGSHPWGGGRRGQGEAGEEGEQGAGGGEGKGQGYAARGEKVTGSQDYRVGRQHTRQGVGPARGT